jgi:hypothetical protein
VKSSTTIPREEHEERDVPVGQVFAFAFGLLGLCVASGLILWGFFALLERRARASEPPPHPMLARDVLPPAPRLQANPQAELAQHRASEEARLSSYGWIDRSAGVVRLPVERAMELVLSEGLPHRSAADHPPSERDR